MSMATNGLGKIPIFEVKKRGYAPEVVDQYISELVGLLNAKTAMVEQLQTQVSRLRLSLSEMNQDEQVGRLVNRATQQAEQIVAEANSQAQQIVAEAQEQADALNTNTDAVRQQMMQQLQEEMTDIKLEKQRLLEETEGLRQQLTILSKEVDAQEIDSLSRMVLEAHDKAVEHMRAKDRVFSALVVIEQSESDVLTLLDAEQVDLPQDEPQQESSASEALPVEVFPSLADATWPDRPVETNTGMEAQHAASPPAPPPGFSPL